MKIPFLTALPGPSLSHIQVHADKLNECAWTFQHAIECLILPTCHSFKGLRGEVNRLVEEADALYRELLKEPKSSAASVHSRSRVYDYFRAQDRVLTAVDHAINWAGVQDVAAELEVAQKEFLLLIEAVVDPVEEMVRMVGNADAYLKRRRRKDLDVIKENILNIRKRWRETEKAEVMVIQKMFASVDDTRRLFHLVRFAEKIGKIATSANQAGESMWELVIE